LTVAPAYTETIYALTGSTLGPFQTVFTYEDDSDVLVWVDLGAGPVLQASGLGYTLTDNGGDSLDNGGQVMLLAAVLDGALVWPANSQITLDRATAQSQPSALGEAIGFSPQAYEDALDHVDRQVQDAGALQARNLRGQPGDVFTALPTAALRAGMLLGFDPVNGAPVVELPSFATSSTPLQFSTLATATAAAIPAASPFVQTQGYAAAGDGGGALYAPAAAGAGLGKFQSADGQWWGLAQQSIRPEMIAATGTGQLASAISYLAAGRGGRLELFAKEYDIAPFTLDVGVNLRGQGPAHQAFYATDPKGTVLAIAGVAAGWLLTFQGEATGGGNYGLSDLSVYQTGTAAIAGLVDIAGLQNAFLQNVEISGQFVNQGVGLYLSRGDLSLPTSFGDFVHLKIDGCNTGLQIDQDCTGNAWHGGSIQGARYALHMTGGANVPAGNSFHGVAFEATFVAGAMEIVYLPPGTNVVGFTPNTTGVYVVKFVKIEQGQSTLFAGCYFELGNLPGSYNDGVNGTHTILGVISVEAGAVDTFFYGCRMACYMLDAGNDTQVKSVQTNLPDYSTKSPPRSIRTTTVATAIPAVVAGVYTPIPFATALEEDSGYFTWNGGATACTVNAPGEYRVDMTLVYGAMAGASTFNLAAALIGGVQRRGRSVMALAATAAGQVCVDLVWQGYLYAGQTIAPQAQCAYGCSLDVAAPDNRIAILKVQ
jgi:hypothetical protein